MHKKRLGWRKRAGVVALVLSLLASFVPVTGQRETAYAEAAMAAERLAAAKAAAITPTPGAGAPAAEASAGSLPAAVDIAGHWAEPAITAWLRQGLANGFPDGSFRPDGQVTRAELAALANRAFRYTKAAAVPFADVAETDWYAPEVARALEAGYMQGDGDGLFRPEASITRQEAAVVIARLLKLDADGAAAAAPFADAQEMAAWSRGAIGAVTAAGIMEGYDGNVFRAGRPLTRAEAVVLLERVRKMAESETTPPPGLASSIDTAGTYGPASGTETFEGDMAINVPNVVLRNVTITGDLLLGEGIGEGDVALNGVVVKGTTTVKGGGRNSVHVLDSTLTRVFITKVDGQVRVVIEGSTAVDQVTVASGATLQVASGSGASYGTVTVSTTGEVTLDGDFPNVVLVAPAQLNVTSGKVDNLTLTEQAAGAGVTLQKNTQVGIVNAGAAATIKGDGAINTVSITSAGVTVAQKPAQTIVAGGISANVGGTTTNGAPAGGAGAGTGNAAGGGDGGDSGPTVIWATATVGNPAANGFDLSLSPAVPNLSIANLVMVNADGMPALVSKLRSTDDGATYRVDGFLTGGASYALTLAMPGYVFGSGMKVVVPDVPAVTGAMTSPDQRKLVVLFSKTMADLPEAPAGFTLTDSGAPVAITGAALSASATRIEFALGAPVHPNTLELRYAPGSVRSADDKALPAFTWRVFANGGTPGGRAAYDRMLGMTAVQTATDLKNNAGINADDAAKAILGGGYNTNALVEALHTVYGISHENMPGMLLPYGISVYHLLIGMKEAGILDVNNLGKNFSYLNGNSDDWIRALKEGGYTDEQVVAISWFFPTLQLAASMRTYYGTSNDRAAKLLSVYSNFRVDVGQVLYQVYQNDDRQAAAAMKAAGLDAGKAGEVLRTDYGVDRDRATDLLHETGYAAGDIGGMLLQTYEATPEQTARTLRKAGYAAQQVWEGLLTVDNPYAALRGAFTAAEYFDFMNRLSGARLNYTVYFMNKAGYSAVETTRALLGNAEIHTKADMVAQLFQIDPMPASVPQAYNPGEVATALRQVYGAPIAEIASLLAQFGVPTATTRQPGQMTIADALGAANFSAADIVSYMAPQSTLTEAQASAVILELRTSGFQLASMKSILGALLYKVYRNASNSGYAKLLAMSGTNTTTNQPIPGYSADEIAAFLIGAGLANNISLVNDLQPAFGKLDAVGAMVNVSGSTMVDTIRILQDSRVFQGSLSDILFVGQVLKDKYGATAVEAVRALRGSYVPDLTGIYAVSQILKQVYGHTDTTTLILDLASAGYTTNQIGDGLTLNGQSFKTAGYSATDVAWFLYSKRNVRLEDMALALKNLGYTLNEVTMALRNMFGSGTNYMLQVTDMLNAPGVGYAPADVAAAVTAVFGVDPFAVLAKELFDRNHDGPDSATFAAASLKGSFGVTDPAVMAGGLKTAGFSRNNVLIAIFQTYCDGYIYASGAIAKMDAVIAAVYPEVSNRLEATLQASDVRTAKYAIAVLQSLNSPLSDTIDILDHVYHLNAVDMLSAMLQNRSHALAKDVAGAVGSHFGQAGVDLYVSMLAAQYYSASDAFPLLQGYFGVNDGVQIALLLKKAGYTQTSILYALGYDYHGDAAPQIALAMVQLYGATDVQTVAKEMGKRNYRALDAYLAIRGALPASAQGDILIALQQSGYFYTELEKAMLDSDFGRGDATAAAQLRNLGLPANEARRVLQDAWHYSAQETLRLLFQLGYAPADIGRTVGSDELTPVQAVAYLLSWNGTLEQAAVMVFAMDSRTSMMLKNLYDGGWRSIDDMAKALVAIKDDPRYYVTDMWEGKQSIGANWTLAQVGAAIARNTPLTLVQLGRSMLEAQIHFQRYFTDMQVYEALKPLADIGVSFIQADLDSAISAMLTDLREGIPFAIMREAGMSGNDAARIMKRLGWDWIPACIQLVQAGYGASDTWDALWDIYHNELGWQILNIMTAVAPLASLGLADNLTTFQSVLRGAMNKAMMYYFTH
ncbi:MAG: S-layer homology domain-containing protein [Paenibacillaceae bacterium]|nr:S-layer homology domain-containing protein [Paenibacillaceae bacterium]